MKEKFFVCLLDSRKYHNNINNWRLKYNVKILVNNYITRTYSFDYYKMDCVNKELLEMKMTHAALITDAFVTKTQILNMKRTDR